MKAIRPIAMTVLMAMCLPLHGQESTRTLLKPNTTPTVIPVWNVHSGQIEALLVLDNEPATTQRAWVRARNSKANVAQVQLMPGVNLDSGMAIFCAGQQTFSQLSLLDSCQLGKKSTRYPAINSPGLETKALLQRKGSHSDLGLLSPAKEQRQFLRTEFDSPASARSNALNLSPAKVQDGWVSINGNLTRARLIPASQFPNGVPTEWDETTFKLPERKRAISGEVVGNVVKIPGQESNIQSIGAGVSWNTPWRSKVSIGAEGLLRQGRSSLDDDSTSAPIIDQSIDGVRPYVRVEIDL